MIFGGLPGVGKTTIARKLVARLAATYVCIDSVEQAIRCSSWGDEPIDDVGYRVAYAVAEDNLRLGNTVIADCVNPLSVTRDAWLEVAGRAGVRAVEIEIVCSDAAEHRQRLEKRATNIAGLRSLSWHEVATREYHEWGRAHLVINTAGRSVDESCEELFAVLVAQRLGRSG